MSQPTLDLDRALVARLKEGSVLEIPPEMAEAFDVDMDALHIALEDGRRGAARFGVVRRIAGIAEDPIRPGFAYAGVPEAQGLTLLVSDARCPGTPLGYLSLALEAEPDRATPGSAARAIWLTVTVQAIFVAADRREEGLGRSLAAGGSAIALDLVARSASQIGMEIAQIRSEVTGRALAPQSDRLMQRMENWLDRVLEMPEAEPAF